MSLILSLETATTVCSVALAEDGKILSSREVDSGYSHAEKLTVFIEEVMKERECRLKDLDAIAISKGPGSYTGLRIGTSVAKGLCYALDKPLIAVDTLKAMAALAISNFSRLNRDQNSNLKLLPIFPIYREGSNFKLYCPMINARRMEVYCALYDGSLIEKMPVAAIVIDEQSFSDVFKTNKIYFFGDGAPKLKDMFSNQPNAIFIDVLPSSIGISLLAETKFREKDFEDLALYEPFYLKEPHLKKPGITQ